MKPKKRQHESSSSDSSESDSSSSSSSSSNQKKSKKDKAKKHYSDSSDSGGSSKKKNKRSESPQDKGKKMRGEFEHSKWDSPVEKNRSNRPRHDDRNDRHQGHSRNKNMSQERNYNRDRHDRHQSGQHDRRDRQSDNQGNRNRRERSYSREDRNRSYERRDNRGGSRDNRRRRSRSKSVDHDNANWGKASNSNSKDSKPAADKEKPNFGLSGKLTEETNTYRGVVIKYSEPPEARKPKRRWRLYPFKGEKAMQTLYIHRQSAYLIGRERKIVDLPVDHPSCSKQHAVLQYRLVNFTRDDGSTGKRIRPYIIDLGSANGTFINNKKIDAKKYVELLEKDVIKFGYSSREYVMLHENSKDEGMDDDVKMEDEEVVKKEEPAD